MSFCSGLTQAAKLKFSVFPYNYRNMQLDYTMPAKYEEDYIHYETKYVPY